MNNHTEQKQQLQGKSQSTKQQKRDLSERPKSAYAQPELQPMPNLPKPNTGLAYRQYSPLVKGSAIPKANQLIATSKNKGWRYPSPGQIKNDESIIQQIINSKPVWK